MAPSRRPPGRRSQQFKREIDDLVRGVCGGFLFGIPMLYTIEVWWVGSLVTPGQLLGVLLTTLLGTYLISRTAGFRRTQATKEWEAFQDAVEAIAIGLICALLMLVTLQQVTLATSLNEALGKVIFESVPFSLGVALSNQLLNNSDDESTQSTADPPGSSPLSTSKQPSANAHINETVADIGVTAIGAIVIAFSIAPTDEVDILVASVSGARLFIIVMVSLTLSYGIVFQANFSRQKQRRQQKGLFQSPMSETVFSYLVSLVAAALMLGFFRKLSFGAPIVLALEQVLILGLPATIGGAAGRLVL